MLFLTCCVYILIQISVSIFYNKLMSLSLHLTLYILTQILPLKFPQNIYHFPSTAKNVETMEPAIHIILWNKSHLKYPCLHNFTYIVMDKLCRTTSPIYFNLLIQFPQDVYGYPTFFFILLNVLAKLKIRKKFFAIHIYISLSIQL